MSELSLHAVAWARDSQSRLLYDDPIQYEVDGLPYPQKAWLIKLSRVWQIVLSVDERYGPLHGSHATADEALAALRSELTRTES